MTSFEFVRKFDRLQEKTCSKLIARIGSEDMVFIYCGDFRDLKLFAYCTSYGYWAFTNQKDRVLVKPKTLKLMAKFTKKIYKNSRK